MKKLVYILFALLFTMTNVVYGQKKSKRPSKKTIREQVKEDVEVLSSKGFPYIEKFHEGVREKISGNLSEAKKLFNECLEIKQDDDAVYFALAQIANKEKNVNEAVKNFEKAAELDPENIVYTQELAYLHFEKYDFDKSEVLFDKLVELDPRNIDFRYGYVRVLIYNRNYKKAIEQIDKMQEQIGVSPELSNMKADLHLEQNNRKEAEETMLQLKREYPDDLEVLRMVIGFYDQLGEQEKAYLIVEELAKKDTQNGIAQFVLAHSYYEKGQIDEFLEIAPSVFKFEDIDVNQKLMLFGMLVEVAKDDEVLYQVTEELYQAHPDNYNVAMEYGISLATQNQTKQALELFRKDIAREKEIMNWMRVLDFEKYHKDYPELYEDGNLAVTTFPSIPDVYYFAAYGALKTDKVDEAVMMLGAGEIYILGDKSALADFSELKGMIHFYNKDYKKGIVEYEKALNYAKGLIGERRKVSEEQIKSSYALELMKANIATDIAEEMLSSMSSKSKFIEYYEASAMLAGSKKDYSKAIEILNAGIDLMRENNAELYDLLGDYHLKAGDSMKAKEAWLKAVEFESRNKNLSKKIKELKYYAPKYY